MENIEKKNIKNVAPFLADDFIDFDESIFDKEEYQEFLDKNEERLGIFSKYIICKLHDSLIINVENKNNSLEIKLNDISTYVFSEAIIEKYNLEVDSGNFTFPLIIKFEGNLKIDYYKVDDEGFLISIEALKLDEYLYEQISEVEEDYIKIVFEFWKSNIDIDKPGERIIVIISAQNIKLIEQQDESWKNIYGGEYYDYYKYFREQFYNGRYLSDFNECLNLVNEFDNFKMAS